MKKPQYQVLLGNCEPMFDDLFVAILENVLQGRFDLHVTKTDHLGELSEEAGSQKFDLCLLVLNNIIVPEPPKSSAKAHIYWVFDFIACLKAKHRTPVIALSEYTDAWLAERAQDAGADYYFTLPVDIPKLKRAFQRCVHIYGKSRGLACAKKFPPLPNPDRMHLSAAQGWLELGSHLEANEELEKIAPELRVHPDVLELRGQVYAEAKKWEECVIIAEALVKTAPDRPNGWIDRSFALHELKRTQEALDLLLPAADLWPGHSTICYNLACYACQLGNQEEAWDWLEQAFELAEDSQKVKLMALDDPDMEPFWAEIGEV